MALITVRNMLEKEVGTILRAPATIKTQPVVIDLHTETKMPTSKLTGKVFFGDMMTVSTDMVATAVDAAAAILITIHTIATTATILMGVIGMVAMVMTFIV